MAGQAAVRHRPQVAYSGHAPGRTAVRTAGSAIQRLVSVDWDDVGGGAYGAKSVQIVRDASSTGGAHSTANVVFEQQIREAIEAQTFGNAFKKLIDLVTGVLGYDELYTKKSTANHKRAIAILIEIRDTDPATIVPLRQQSVLQKSAQDYITARNLMDDAIITGVTGTKAIGEESEKTHKTIIKNAKDTINNSGGTSGVLPYAKSLVALFDYQSVVAAYPKMKDIAPLFARHVKDIFRAFPLGDPKYEAKVVEAMPTQGTQIEKSLVKKFL
jgi:hypothetical protein